MNEPFVNQRLVLAGTQRLIVDPGTGGQSVVNAGPAGPRGLASFGSGGSAGGTIFVDGFGFPTNGTTFTSLATATHVSLDGNNHEQLHPDDVVAFYRVSTPLESDVVGIYICDAPGSNSLVVAPTNGLSITVKSDSTQEADFGHGLFGLYGANLVLEERGAMFIATSSVATAFEISENFVNNHKAENYPHTAYDDLASFTLLFENGLV